MSPQELQKMLQRKMQEIERLRAKAPDIMGTLAVQVFRRNFRVSGYIQSGAIARWPARVPGSPRNSGRARLEGRYAIGAIDVLAALCRLDHLPLHGWLLAHRVCEKLPI